MKRRAKGFVLVLILFLFGFLGKIQAAPIDRTESLFGNDGMEKQDTAADPVMMQAECRCRSLGDDTDNNDILYEKYIYHLFYPQEGPAADPASASHSDQLNYQSRNLCLQLMSRVSMVAAGEISDTIFSHRLQDLGFGNDILNQYWTAADLGVDRLIDENNYVTAEAYEAILDKLDIDLYLIINILLADYPYEFYWFDKTYGYSVSVDFGVTQNSNGEDCFYFTNNCEYRVSLAVASAYAVNGVLGSFETDLSKTSVASQAAKNVQSILSATEYDSAYVKLKAYKEAICNLVAYNHDAAEDDSIPYGDPWQLIYVFDGNANTNVVCEGYAKAYKYLCDRAFGLSMEVSCITVTGWMAGGTGAGPHMWNLVSFRNSTENYLVDVTNCDDGTIGAPEQLFMAGYTSGSIENGYILTCSGSEIGYLYDDMMRSVYSIAELTLSQNRYVPSGSYCDREGHSWGNPAWTWYDNYRSAKAVFTCKNDPAHVEEVWATVTNNLENDIITYTATVEFAGRTYTKRVQKQVSPIIVKSASAIVNDRIDLRFKIEVPDYGGIAVLEYDNGIGGYTSRSYPVTLPGDYTLVMENIPAKEMGVKIKLYVIDSEGRVLKLENTKGRLFEDNTLQYSVSDYLNSLIALEGDPKYDKYVLLAKTMLNYGEAAQKHFQYRMDELVNPEGYMHTEMQNVQVNTAYNGVFPSAADRTKIGFQTLSINLEGETQIFLYFSHEVTAKDEKGNYYAGEQIGDRYRVIVSGIRSNELHKLYTIIVTENGKNYTFKCCALTYCNTVLSSSSTAITESMRSVCRALYLYNSSAVEAFGER